MLLHAPGIEIITKTSTYFRWSGKGRCFQILDYLLLLQATHSYLLQPCKRRDLVENHLRLQHEIVSSNQIKIHRSAFRVSIQELLKIISPISVHLIPIKESWPAGISIGVGSSRRIRHLESPGLQPLILVSIARLNPVA